MRGRWEVVSDRRLGEVGAGPSGNRLIGTFA